MTVFYHCEQDLPDVATVILMIVEDADAPQGIFWQHLIEEGITEAIFRFLLESMLSKVVSQQQTVVRGLPSSSTECLLVRSSS